MGINIVTHDRPEYVMQRRVSMGFFRVLGVPLAVGREFSAEEDRAGGPTAVILLGRPKGLRYRKSKGLRYRNGVVAVAQPFRAAVTSAGPGDR